MENTNKRSKALPFIVNKNGDFTITEEAKTFLRTLDGKKIGVICIVGKYRTGKSYFINKVILDRKAEKGFNVGPTINPCTKGLWIWNQTLKKTQNNGEEIEMIVMDCEGFGGMDENENHDTRIFLFAILLSSFFIYNSLNSIDENALQTLSLVINLAKNIKSSVGKPGLNEDISDTFPSFLWVIRDFTLKLLDEAGDPITSKQYLESALAKQKGCSEAVENKNRIRGLLKHFFRERDCVTMVRPVELERDLQKLDTLSEKHLRPQFLKQMNRAREKIMRKAKAKTLNSQPITGEMFLHLTKAYIEAVNSGKVPNIESAWSYVCQEKLQDAVTKTLDDVERMFESDEIKQMLSDDLDWKSNIRRKLLKKFKGESNFGDEEMVKEKSEELEVEIEKKLKEIEKKMIYGQAKEAKKWLTKRYQPLLDMVNQEKLKEVHIYERMMSQIKEDFEREHSELSERQIDKMFKEFKVEKEPQAMACIMRLKEDESRKEVQKNKGEIEQLRNENLRIREQYEQQLSDMRKKLQESEEEKFRYKAQVETFDSKLENIENKHNFEKERILEKEKNLKFEYSDKNNNLESEVIDMKKRIRDLELRETELIQTKVKFEQMYYQEKELNSKRVEMLENSLSSTKKTLTEKEEEISKLKSQVKKTDKSKEVESLAEELEELRSKKRSQDSQLGNLRMEKQYLDSKIQFLNAQIEEGKKIHETLLSALQNQLNNDDNNSTNQLFMTNKNLVSTLGKAEARIKKLETKMAKYKLYKKVVQEASAIQLKSSSRVLPIKKVLQIVQNNTNNLDLSSLYTSIPLSNSPKNNQRGMTASIIHTLVKEDPETSKVFTEYIIEMRTCDNKWNITRKYKDFVELHHELMNQFPDIEFPSSTSQILGFTPNIAAWMSSKRRTVIEDRRKALETYLNELLGMPEIANSEILVQFLELLDHTNDLSINHTEDNNYNHRSNQRTHQSANVKENLNSSKFSRFEFNNRFSEKTKYYKQNISGKKKERSSANLLEHKPSVSHYEAGSSHLSPYKFRGGKSLLQRVANNSPYYK